LKTVKPRAPVPRPVKGQGQGDVCVSAGSLHTYKSTLSFAYEETLRLPSQRIPTERDGSGKEFPTRHASWAIQNGVISLFPSGRTAWADQLYNPSWGTHTPSTTHLCAPKSHPHSLSSPSDAPTITANLAFHPRRSSRNLLLPGASPSAGTDVQNIKNA